MFENNYNSETNTTETEYIPSELTNGKNKKKKGTAKKIFIGICSLCCVAGISFGAISGYRYFKNDDDDSNKSILSADKEKDNKNSSESQQKENEKKDYSDYETTNLVQLSKSEDALTTQEIYKKVIPSVVGVTSVFEYETSASQYGGFFGYGQDDGGGSTQTVSGTGTGIIISEDGYILTNAHVVNYEKSGAAKEVTILMSDESECPAEIIGYDVLTDIALLKVDKTGLTAAELGDSSDIQVGDPAVAIGNPLGFDLFGTLTVGFISGVDREMDTDDMVMKLIQTDAAINSGNSGGPLINDRGQIIGINSMKLSSSYASSEATIEGLGFAIPMNQAQEIVSDLMQHGHVTGRPMLGVTCQNVTSSQSQQYYSDSSPSANKMPTNGVLVAKFDENSAAEKAGVQIGDVIVGANGKEVKTIQELNKEKNQFKAGDTLKLTIIRENKYCYIDVILGEITE